MRARYGEGPFHLRAGSREIAAAGPPADRGGRFRGDGVRLRLGHASGEFHARSATCFRRSTRQLHALVTDLEERGLLDDVAILMGGEFGRTPRIGDITPDGRSHWPDAGFLWMAGGRLADRANHRRHRRAG